MSLKTEDLIAGLKKHPVSFACGLITLGLLLTNYFRGDLLPAQQVELDGKTVLAQRLQTNVLNSEKLVEQLDTLTSANEAVRKRAIRPSDLANNIQYFYRIESESGVKYKDVRPVGQGAAAVGGKNYVAVNYSVVVDGGYTQLLGFLRRLERGSSFSRITSFVMSNSSPGAGAVAGEITLTLTVDLLAVP